jgi:apolipoprotein N-acyltransferase
VFTREVMVTEVPTRDGRTLATRLGAAPELVLSVVGLLALLLPAARRRAGA